LEWGGGRRLLAHLHKYPPDHNAGAEWTAHLLLSELASNGWKVSVLARDQGADYDFEGIPVMTARSPANLYGSYQHTDLVLTHLDVAHAAAARARRERLPIVHLIHNHRQLDRVNANPSNAAVYNSRWLATASVWAGRSVVMHPLVPLARYRPTGGRHDAVTLVNLYAPKGAAVFYETARLLPERRFLAVRGAYGEQVLPPSDLGNVEVVDHNPDFSEILSETRVLVMPSTYESWGRVCQEAAAAQIPAVVSETPGLLENGTATRFLPQDASPVEWAEAVEAVWGDWAAAGRTAQARAAVLEGRTRQQLGDVIRLLIGLTD
jgi:glycosyltransferase involved in cell wall biosynthesis